MDPILIMSSERSGSNLVRRMLAAHRELAAPPPPHLWDLLLPMLPRYGPLAEGERWRDLVSDAIALTRVEGSHTFWRHELSVDEVAARARRRNLSGLIGAMYECYAAREGRARWVCKENNLFQHAFRILDVFPGTHVIYLVRDGRDVACSMRKVPTHDQHAYFIAREWRDEQRRCVSVYLDLLDSGRATLLRYEELIEAPERELRRLCGRAGLAFEPAMLAFHEEKESKEDARKTLYWKNLDRPVQSGNRAKYRTELSRKDVEVFESVAGPELALLGYPLETPSRTRISGLERGLFKLQNDWHLRRKRREYYEEPGRRERDDELGRVRKAREREPARPLAERLEYGAWSGGAARPAGN
jgi:hypothetical protein